VIPWRQVRRTKGGSVLGSTDVAESEVAVVTARSLTRLRYQARLLRMRPGKLRAARSGPHSAPVRGRGMEFSESRPYQVGDDLRSLDWRVMARTGRPHTKLYRVERERPVLLWVDLRPAMFFATRGVLKAVQAARIAGLIAWSAIDHGDRVGGIVLGARGATELRPTLGPRGALAMIGALAREFVRDAPPERNQVPDTLAVLRRVTRPGSLICLVSDLAGLGATEQGQVTQLARHNDVVLMGIHDPIEAELPPPGLYAVTDGHSEWAIDSGNESVRRAHRERHERRMAHLSGLCRKSRMQWISCATDDDPAIILGERFATPRLDV